jgi:hypothetical protein
MMVVRQNSYLPMRTKVEFLKIPRTKAYIKVYMPEAMKSF